MMFLLLLLLVLVLVLILVLVVLFLQFLRVGWAQLGGSGLGPLIQLQADIG